MNYAAIRAIVARDLRTLSRSRGVLVPLFLVPLVLLMVLPGLAAMAPSTTGIPESLMYEIVRLSQVMPQEFKQGLEGMTIEQLWVTLILLNFMAPFYLVVPLMVASVIAADSFAGERERGTLEALVTTPTTDLELFVAKLVGAWLPAVCVGLLSFVLYGVTINIAAWPTMGEIFFPNIEWIALALWVGPGAAALGLSFGVLISARVRTVQEASQLGSIIVIPVVMLVLAQLSGRVTLDLSRVLLMGLFLWTVDALLLACARLVCRRHALLTRV